MVRLPAIVGLCFTACLTFPPATTDVGNDGGVPPGDGAVRLPDGGDVPLPPPKAPCDAAAQPSPAGVFVSTKGDDLLGGTRAAPVKTIGKALALAKAQAAADVYVDEGVYAEEINLASATTVHGGWKATGASWSKDCTDGVVGLTVLRSTTARAITVTGFSGTAGLDMLTVTTKGQADAGQSTIAIFVSGASLNLSGVDVAAGLGGDGTTPAVPAQTGNRTCNGFACSSGAPGGPGAPGSPAAAGQFDVTGWVVSVGTAGQPGGQGEHGVAGGAGGSVDGCVQSCGATPTCASGGLGTSTGGTGTCGCGGLGGAPGAAGTSGGASVAVMIVGPGVLDARFSNVTSGRGGAGAAGALGGPGGAGTAGAGGAAGFCAGSCFYNTSTMTCYFSGNGLGGGPAGGNGGGGATGGQGGGGAGGPSYGVVAIQGATLVVDPSVAFKAGAGGAGAGGAPTGASGNTLTL